MNVEGTRFHRLDEVSDTPQIPIDQLPVGKTGAGVHLLSDAPILLSVWIVFPVLEHLTPIDTRIDHVPPEAEAGALPGMHERYAA